MPSKRFLTISFAFDIVNTIMYLIDTLMAILGMLYLSFRLASNPSELSLSDGLVLLVIAILIIATYLTVITGLVLNSIVLIRVTNNHLNMTKYILYLVAGGLALIIPLMLPICAVIQLIALFIPDQLRQQLASKKN